MKYIIDISPDTVDLIQKYIDKGEYRTVQDFIATSIHNQIYLIEHPDSLAPIVSNVQTIVSKPNIKEELKPGNFSEIPIKNLQVSTRKQNSANSTLSGFWNKFFPIKIALRVLANILNENESSVLLDLLQENASLEARKIGLDLKRKEKGSGRKRGDRLFTGLPVKRSSEKSRGRYKSHFVGSLSKDRVRGMPGTLGLLNIFKGTNGRDYVSITDKGLEFAKLRNPILDDDELSGTLSEKEQNFLISEIRSVLPNEYKEIIYVLNQVAEGKDNSASLLQMLKVHNPEVSQNKLMIFLSGILNRLVDLHLLVRIHDGLSYQYAVSEKGQDIISEA